MNSIILALLLTSTQSVLFIDGNNTALASAFAREKECAGLTVSGQREHFTWAMAQHVGDGRGHYQIWLERETDARHIFLGTNVKKAANRACKIITGKETWVGLPLD